MSVEDAERQPMKVLKLKSIPTLDSSATDLSFIDFNSFPKLCRPAASRKEVKHRLNLMSSNI